MFSVFFLPPHLRIGSRFPDDIQYLFTSLLVDGERAWLLSYNSAWLPFGSTRPSCDHGQWLPAGLPVHRGGQLCPASVPRSKWHDRNSTVRFKSDFCDWNLFLFQLFGFVYACYVSKVFLDDEDSCKCYLLNRLLIWSQTHFLNTMPTIVSVCFVSLRILQLISSVGLTRMGISPHRRVPTYSCSLFTRR